MQELRLSEMDLHMQRHFDAEKNTLNILLKLEDLFRNHHALTLKEMETQREYMGRLWILTHRYIILISTGPCCKFPDVFASPTAEVILHEFNDKLKALRISNCRINDSLTRLRTTYNQFESECAKLDMSVESPYIIGDFFHKPISFFIELVSDLFRYMHALILKLSCRAHELDPLEVAPLEEYKVLLEPSNEFDEYLLDGLTYCKCLRPKPVCRQIY